MADAARGHATATLSESAGTPVALHHRLRPAWSGARICGPAFTVQGRAGDNLVLHHAVVAAPAGSVLVVDVGRGRFGHWGEVLAVAAQQRGLQGLVIDGGVRDTDELASLGFGVFSCRNSIVGTGKAFAGELGNPVRVGGRVIATGDLMVGDVDGVVSIPAADAARVLDAADDRVQRERDYLERLRNGETTLEIYGLPARRATPVT